MDIPTATTTAPPIHQLSFEDWVHASWALNRFRDDYLEDFGEDEARYAAVSQGGSRQDAERVYLQTLLSQPRHLTLTMAVYDSLPDLVQPLARAHYISLEDDLEWRSGIEAEIATGVRLFVPREQIRATAQQQAVMLYKTAAADDLPPGSSVSVPYRRDGVSAGSRAAGTVHAEDGQLWLKARAPGSACITPQRYLLATAYALLAPGGRPERPPAELQGTCALDQRDLFELDERPDSAYYVTARQSNGRSALLLGPFPHHLDAVCNISIARAYVWNQAASSQASDLAIGTGRLDRGLAPLPPGKLNELLLEHEQHRRVADLLGVAWLDRGMSAAV